MTNIRLEDDWEPSWDDAKTRLKVAAETFGFPFWITMDEVAYAYKDLQSFVDERADGEVLSATERDAIRNWWIEFAYPVNDYETGLRVLYPWFHEGEEMPIRIKLEGRIGGFQ